MCNNWSPRNQVLVGDAAVGGFMQRTLGMAYFPAFAYFLVRPKFRTSKKSSF